MEQEYSDHPSDDYKETKMDLEDCSSARVDLASEVTTAYSLPRLPIKFTLLEKVVFCIDQGMGRQNLNKLKNAITLFVENKKLISSKPLEFHYAILKLNATEFVHSTNIDILAKFTEFKKCDNSYFDLSDLFNNLAKFEIPNPLTCGSFDSPFIYHFILLYGSNDSIPTLKSPNSYYFLINNPFVTLDILHINKPKSINIEKISEILQCLVPAQKGYFQTSDSHNLNRNLMKFVGNPLLRQ